MLLNDPRISHTTQAPSPWVVRWSHLAREGGFALDVACGSGRHMQWLAERGHPVTGVDRAGEALRSAAAFGKTMLADIENGPWPFAGKLFDLVVVTNYLWRPRLPDIVAALAPGGVLLYETFAAGNETVGKPSRPDFLLQPGELLAACTGLHVIGYEDGYLETPPRFVQRIAAMRSTEPGARHRLES
ncbi:MAG: class I SAM-dependent methyltransferase [Pseudomonadota bacterium]